MNDFMSPESYLDLLTRYVAELANQLRPSSEEIHPGGPLPGCTMRLGVRADLLTSQELQGELGGLAALGGAAASLTETMYEGPGKDLGYLEPALAQLAEAMEGALGQLDAGESPESLGGDPVWLTVLSRLRSAGTPLEIMDELDACARQWEDRWCKCELPPDQDHQLRQRWLTFREYGDAMFGFQEKGSPNKIDQGEKSASVVLLVDGVLRREQLLHKLQDLGLAAQATTSPEAAMSLVRPQGRARAIICDNLEPSNHLVHLGRLNVSPKDRPALVLISTGPGHPAAELQRARNLGADGIWTEPFNTQPLAGIGVPSR